MNMKETTLARDVVDHYAFVAECSRMPTQANALYRDPKPTVTLLIFTICGWSLIEAPFEYGASTDDTWLLALIVAKLIIVFTGAAAIADVRFARSIFAFVCGTSVLAIAPGLPLEFQRSVAISLLSLIECASKTAFVIAFCAQSMRDKPS